MRARQIADKLASETGKMLASSRATAPSVAPYGCGLGNFPRVGLTTFRRR